MKAMMMLAILGLGSIAHAKCTDFSGTYTAYNPDRLDTHFVKIEQDECNSLRVNEFEKLRDPKPKISTEFEQFGSYESFSYLGLNGVKVNGFVDNSFIETTVLNKKIGIFPAVCNQVYIKEDADTIIGTSTCRFGLKVVYERMIDSANH